MATLLLMNMIRFILIGLELVVFARVVLSFVEPGGRGALARFVISTTEPVRAPVRRLLPRTGMFDLSPMVIIIAIGVLLRFVG